MRSSRFLAGSVAALVTLSLVAACGSSSKKAVTTPSSTGGSSSAAATGTPIIIGNIGSYSGAQASSIGGAQKVINAWAQWVNAHGGVSGHPIQLIVKDDANSPATSLSQVKELVEQDHVVAIVADQSDYDQTWQAYVASKGVPIIGGLPINLPFATNPDFFASGQNIFGAIYHALTLAKSVGPKFGYLYCAESPQCASSVPLFQGLAQAVGVTVSVSVKISGSAPDYTAVCQELKSKGVQSYQVGSGSAVAIRIATACAQQGVKAVQIATDGTITNAWAPVPALDGALAAELSFPFFDSSTPATKEYQDAIAKYAPTLGDANGPNSSYAWVAAKLFEKAVANAPAGPITSASLKAGLYKMSGETLGGLVGPITFTAGKPGLINCGFTVSLKGGKFTTPNGLTTTCTPDAVVTGILKSLGG